MVAIGNNVGPRLEYPQRQRDDGGGRTTSGAVWGRAMHVVDGAEVGAEGGTSLEPSGGPGGRRDDERDKRAGRWSSLAAEGGAARVDCEAQAGTSGLALAPGRPFLPIKGSSHRPSRSSSSLLHQPTTTDDRRPQP